MKLKLGPSSPVFFTALIIALSLCALRSISAEEDHCDYDRNTPAIEHARSLYTNLEFKCAELEANDYLMKPGRSSKEKADAHLLLAAIYSYLYRDEGERVKKVRDQFRMAFDVCPDWHGVPDKITRSFIVMMEDVRNEVLAEQGESVNLVQEPRKEVNLDTMRGPSGSYVYSTNLTWQKGRRTIRLNDGGFVSAGAGRGRPGAGLDMYLVRMDRSGRVLWRRAYGGDKDDCAADIVETYDGGLAIVGWTDSWKDGANKDAYLVRTDKNGFAVWERIIDLDSEERGLSLAQAPNGGFIVIGTTHDSETHNSDIMVESVDAYGQALWNRVIHGAGDEIAASIVLTQDGGCAIAGLVRANTGATSDVLVVKLDSTGEVLWRRTVGGAMNDFGLAINTTEKGGFAIAGCSFSYGGGRGDAYLILLDDSGNELAEETFGGPRWDISKDVVQLNDGGFLLLGSTTSPETGSCDLFLIRTTERGERIWCRTFDRGDVDQGQRIFQTAHDEITIVGECGSLLNDTWDVCVVVTDSKGFKISEW